MHQETNSRVNDDLLRIKSISEVSTATVPDSYCTNEDWQAYFKSLASIVEPKSHKRITHKDIQNHNSVFYSNPKTNDGEMLWQCYCSFINDTLSLIRRGECCYCFYIYQIAELLQFEHDRLNTEWMPEQKCFKVWLESERM